MDSKIDLNLDYFRRFGAELEVNSFDMLDRPVGYASGKLPAGIHYIGNLVKKTTNEPVLIHKWGNDHHNESWIIKPDGSCGMEICSPVLKGWNGLMRLCKVIDALKLDPKISADSRCSFHVHVDVSDLTEHQLATVLTWWIKCEPVFIDSVPASRKKNQYCQVIGMTDIFEDIEDGFISPEVLFRKLGHCKYYTINTFHYLNKKRKTIEFRIMDSACCKDSWMAKNWIRLIIHFVEQAVKKGMPESYMMGDRWSGYCWLDPIDVFDFLGFSGEENISSGLKQVREWFSGRLFFQGRNSTLQGVLSDQGRFIAQQQIGELYADYGRDTLVYSDDIYSENFRI